MTAATKGGPTLTPGGLQALRQRMSRLVEGERRAGIGYGVMQHGELVALEALGERDRSRHLPMTTDTVFRIFSMTRAVSTVAFLSLVDDGRLKLDERVDHYLPELSGLGVLDPADPAGPCQRLERPITVRHLFTYTGGFSYLEQPEIPLGLRDVINQEQTLAEGIERLAACPLVSQPGDAWHYGLSSDVLGRVAEVATGQTLDQILAQRVLGPLELSDTDFCARPEKAALISRCYGPGADGPLTDLSSSYQDAYGDFTVPPRFLSAGGGLCSTVGDYLRFVDFLARGEASAGTSRSPISEATRAEMLDVQVRADGGCTFWYVPRTGAYSDWLDWGFGIGVVGESAAGKVPSVGGAAAWAGLMSTFFFLDRGAQLAAVVMSQYIGPAGDEVGNEFRAGVYDALG